MIATIPALLPPRGRRHAGVAATVLVHAVLLLAWQASRRAPSVAPEPPRTTIQWIRLSPPATTKPRHEDERAPPVRPHMAPRAGAITVPRPAAPVAAPPAPAAPGAGGVADTPPAPSAPSVPSAGAALLERARRDAGAVDRALRKENNPYIVAPPDSPQIRMRKGMQAAADMAPNAWYEAPKTAELINNTGDGARRTRVITGGGTYCVTERAPTTSIDMIEKHGKQRLTNCPSGESTANGQEWRTARD
jgi:hypothetical protein